MRNGERREGGGWAAAEERGRERAPELQNAPRLGKARYLESPGKESLGSLPNCSKGFGSSLARPGLEGAAKNPTARPARHVWSFI